MSEKDKTSQDLGEGRPAASGRAGEAAGAGSKAAHTASKGQSRDDRLAEALRANLRRRKTAARKPKAE